MTITSMLYEVRPLVFSGLMNIRLVGAVAMGAALTWIVASSGLDAWINDLARLQNDSFSVAWSAIPMLAGMVVPALVPIGLAIFKRRKEAILTAAAFFVALIVVTLLKGVTSRVHPEAIEPATSLLRSQAFRFGILQDGISSIIEGWPSGHTATNGAVALTLAGTTTIAALRLASNVWFGWVALATIFGISGDVHWLSDTLAGGLIAWAISTCLLRTGSAERRGSSIEQENYEVSPYRSR